jgi:hypothetical protein
MAMGTEESQSVQRATTTMESAMGAAFIAGGVGSVALGLMIIGAETNANIRTALTWNTGVGPLSGKTGIAVIAFVVSWVILHFYFRDRPVKLARSFTISLVLIVLGLLLSFPPIFLLFEAG